MAHRSYGRHDHGAARALATTAIAVRNARVKVDRIALTEDVFVGPNLHAQRSLQHIDELRAAVGVWSSLVGYYRQELRVVRVEPSLDCRVVERFEMECTVARLGPLGQSDPLALAYDRD